MSSNKIRLQVAILTISDSVANGTREDRSGVRLRERVQELGWAVRTTGVVADDVSEIAAIFRRWAGEVGVHVILSTGGTGISARDVTPEAARTVIDKEIPGIGELMRAKGLQSTPLAPLSRSLAGARGSVLIAILPGSPKGAMESLDAIAHLIPHMVDLLQGRTSHEPVRN